MRTSVRIALELIALAVVVNVCWMLISERATEKRQAGCFLTDGPQEHSNILYLGNQARSSGPVDITVRPPMDFKGKSKAEIMALRREQIIEDRKYTCVDQDYQPSEALFGGIDGQRPWWGLAGEYYYDSQWIGEKNIEGLSEESRFVLNPFLLVGITDIDSVTDIDLGDNWDVKQDKGNQLPPAYYGPHHLVWWPAQNRAEARYDAGDRARQFLREEHAQSAGETRRVLFYLTAYNAQDFGFRWAYVSLADSQNIWHPSHASEPFLLRELIHVGGSCGYPGGCNNASPYVPELCCFRADHLPAKVQVHLWKEKPGSASAKPDMIFDIWVE